MSTIMINVCRNVVEALRFTSRYRYDLFVTQWQSPGREPEFFVFDDHQDAEACWRLIPHMLAYFKEKRIDLKVYLEGGKCRITAMNWDRSVRAEWECELLPEGLGQVLLRTQDERWEP